MHLLTSMFIDSTETGELSDLSSAYRNASLTLRGFPADLYKPDGRQSVLGAIELSLVKHEDERVTRATAELAGLHAKHIHDTVICAQWLENCQRDAKALRDSINSAKKTIDLSAIGWVGQTSLPTRRMMLNLLAAATLLRQLKAAEATMLQHLESIKDDWQSLRLVAEMTEVEIQAALA